MQRCVLLLILITIYATTTMQLADVQNNFPDVICTPNASYKPCLKRNRKKADAELITSTSRINGMQPFISSHFPSAVTHTVSLGHRESG